MTRPVYLNLKQTAVTRLSSLRHMAEAQGKTWKEVRQWTFANWEAAYGTLSQGFNDGGPFGGKRPIWYTHAGPVFRREKFCDEVEGVRINHTGWYTDSNGDRGTYRGFIASLPHGRFLAGYYSSENGERVYFPDVYDADDERRAAYAADSEAQRAAEKEQEYNARWDAKRDIEDKLERKLERLRECLALRNDPAFKGYIRELGLGIVETVRKLRKELAEDYKDID